MRTRAEKAGQLDLVGEGFGVAWDTHGLEIRVADHRNAPLRLPWTLVQDLASRAGVSLRPGVDDRTDGAVQRGHLEPSDEEALAILELTAMASEGEIKQAHHDLVKVWQPGRFKSNPRLRARAQARLRRINEAYRTLKGRRPSSRESKRGSREMDLPTARPPASRPAPVGDETQIRPPALSEIRVPEGALALLVHEGGALHFPITSEAARIGRFDPVTGSMPEIDLSRLDINRSVSRRHARIVFDGVSFVLSEEPGALNGTFINGQRLTPGDPAPLRSGDRLGFGMISFVFKVSEKAGSTQTARKG